MRPLEGARGWRESIGRSGRAETPKYIGTISPRHVTTCRTDCNLRANVGTGRGYTDMYSAIS